LNWIPCLPAGRPLEFILAKARAGMTIKNMALNKDNNFLQSDIWRKFQEAVGHKTFVIKTDDFYAGIIEHQLPVVGKYLYTPRGPLMGISNFKFQISNEIQSSNDKIKKGIQCLIELAKKNSAGWIRIDPENEEALNLIRKSTKFKINKAPHDMQPRELFVMGITKSEEELLTGMKSKTRYNIKLATRNLKLTTCLTRQKKDIEKFLRLIQVTEKRKGIRFHPGSYYRKMIETIPEDILRLYVAEYENKVIAVNLVIFYGDTATYLHGATDDEYRNVMAPYLLQWQAILGAKKLGYNFYDFGGIKTEDQGSKFNPPAGGQNSGGWSGITKFKLGFAPNTEPVIFPGSYDIIIERKKYYLYRVIQKIKNVF
jgi:lipid II:glycine glycyltransferase (peptidoglycan interpeptide bridge formation enzyme)